MPGAASYGETLVRELMVRLKAISVDSLSTIAAAADRLSVGIEAGGIVHTFGSGHSALVVRDAVSRAGGLVPMNQIIDYTAGMAEPIAGYGDLMLRSYDEQYQLAAGEWIVIVSNSGANALPVEIAMGCKSRGLGVVAILSMAQATGSEARHHSGLRLHEVADYNIDTHGTPGDALVPLRGESGIALGPGSGVLGSFALQLLVAHICDELTARGAPVPIFMSKHLPGAMEWNAALRLRYRGRLRRTAA